MVQRTVASTHYFEMIYKTLKIIPIGDLFLAQGTPLRQRNPDKGLRYQTPSARPKSKESVYCQKQPTKHPYLIDNTFERVFSVNDSTIYFPFILLPLIVFYSLYPQALLRHYFRAKVTTGSPPLFSL